MAGAAVTRQRDSIGASRNRILYFRIQIIHSERFLEDRLRHWRLIDNLDGDGRVLVNRE